MNIYLAKGLPACGKTTLLKKECEKILEKKETVVCINMDEYIDETLSEKKVSIEKKLRLYSRINNVFMDGLFLTNSDILIASSIILDIYNRFTVPLDDTINITVYEFETDRMKSLNNDLGRRNKNSSYTILNSPVESLNQSFLIEELFKIKGRFNTINLDIIYSKIYKKTKLEIFSESNNVYKNKIESDSWATGGNHIDCWGEESTIYPEFEPEIFKELYDLISNNIDGNIDNIYEEIFNKYVYTQDYDDADYYGGCVFYSYYVCNIENVYEILKKYNKNL